MEDWNVEDDISPEHRRKILEALPPRLRVLVEKIHYTYPERDEDGITVMVHLRSLKDDEFYRVDYSFVLNTEGRLIAQDSIRVDKDLEYVKKNYTSGVAELACQPQNIR